MHSFTGRAKGWRRLGRGPSRWPCHGIYIVGMIPRPAFLSAIAALVPLAEPPARYTGGGIPKGIVIGIGLVLLYFLPTMLAWAGGKRRKVKVTVVNLFTGWTILGWIAAMLMVWAYEAPDADSSGADAP